MKKQNDWWNNKRLSPKEKNEMLVETCQRLFNTEDGKIVLNMLLNDLRLYEPANTKREKTLNEYAKFFIRERLGLSGTKSLTDFIAQTAFETISSGGGYKNAEPD